jgi:2-C-methyl-D-erythritol 4-phosphate cytidylyltransferase
MYVDILRDVLTGDSDAEKRHWSTVNATEDASDLELRLRECGDVFRGHFDRMRTASGRNGFRNDYAYEWGCARAFVSIDIIHRCMSAVALYESCVVGMPTKDTVKITDDHRKVLDTPDRSNVWIVQTPQCFEYNLIKGAYDKIIADADTSITDDAMIVEKATDHEVHMIQGSYMNIKVTTPEDVAFGETILKNSR